MTDIAGDWLEIFLPQTPLIFSLRSRSGSVISAVRISRYDPMYGASIYDYKGAFENGRLHLEMDPSPQSIRQSRSHTAFVNGQRVMVQPDVVSLGRVSLTGN